MREGEALLHFYRTVFCDLLTGRMVRGWAEKSVEIAVHLEACIPWRSSSVEEHLDNAVEMEALAVKAEHGNVLWGGQRLNRCGMGEC